IQEFFMSDPIVIVSAVRTPMGSFQGDFSALSAHDLGGDRRDVGQVVDSVDGHQFLGVAHRGQSGDAGHVIATGSGGESSLVQVAGGQFGRLGEAEQFDVGGRRTTRRSRLGQAVRLAHGGLAHGGPFRTRISALCAEKLPNNSTL
ncbi:MAG: hypothetical protein EBX95_06170, partial [Acidimicrobiia bacterium]|nr:hypothetical protein [Acidimicrobiia bacterium]